MSAFSRTLDLACVVAYCSTCRLLCVQYTVDRKYQGTPPPPSSRGQKQALTQKIGEKIGASAAEIEV